MRVLISSAYLGGIGGAERALFSILCALDADTVDVVVRERLDGHLADVGSHARVATVEDWRWRAAGHRSGTYGYIAQRVINPIRRRILPSYDVYLQFFSGANLAATVRASMKLFIPSGNRVPADTARFFDYVALQAPDNVKFLPADVQGLLLPPPVLPLSEQSLSDGLALPEDFFLTVFNPYDPIKGLEDLARALDTAPHPIVWCHSERTLRFDIPQEFLDHPGIIHVDDPSPSQLRYLYENTRAYLSFSKSEGFGWSIADALRYSRAIVARRVGVLTFPDADVRRVIYVSEPWSIDWELVEARVSEPAVGLDWLSPERFRRALVDALHEQ